MGKALRLVEIVGGLAGLVGLVLFLTATEDGKRAAGEIGGFVYPGPLIGLMVLVIAVLIVALLRERGRADVEPELVERDRRLMDDLVSVLPRASVTWIRGHDFGGSWTDQELRPFEVYMHERDAVECEFSDPEMEAKRAELMEAVKGFLHETAMRAVEDRHERYTLKAWADNPRPGPREEYEQRYQESRKVINDAADATTTAYDDLVALAKDKGLLS
jgi:hypothetical protein